MTFILTLIIVAMAAVWFFNLSASNRATVAKAAGNGVAIGATYSMSMGKSAIRTGYDVSVGAAMYTESELGVQLQATSDWSHSVQTAGGSIKVGATNAKAHRDFIGATQVGVAASEFLAAQVAKGSGVAGPVVPPVAS